MAEVIAPFLLLVFISVISQGNGQDAGNLGVLHVEGTTDWQDFCIAYNTMWSSIPTDIDKTPKYSLVEAKPSTLCQQPENALDIQGSAVAIQRGNCTLFTKGLIAKNAGAEEVIIVSNDTLFTPDANSSAQYSKADIPMAVISQEDWIKLKNKDFGRNIKVQLYAPPAGSIDGNLAVLWILAVGTVTVGAYWCGITTKERMMRLLRKNLYTTEEQNEVDKSNEDDGSVEVTPLMVVVFVFLICGTLLLLYYFFDYLVYVVIVLFCLAACNGLYECLRPIVLWLPFGDCKVPPNRIPLLKGEPQIRIIMLIAFCMAVSIWWGIERHKSYAWVLQDILGISFSISLIRNIRLPNLKVCTMLLVLLLIYDIFFVFITPLFSAGKSIMVEVATGGGSKEQLPMVFKVPRLSKSALSVCLRPYSLLGFGDILVPALYIGFCHSFDVMTNTPRKIYFIATSIAYGVGLFITFVMLFVMEQGQPALLYLVPCTLITGLVIGWRRGELKKLWTGQMVPEDAGLDDNNESEDEILNRESLTKRLLESENK